MMMMASLLLLLLLLAPTVLATLPADNGGAVIYAPGDLAPSFKVVCSGATVGTNYTLASSSGVTTVDASGTAERLPSSLLVFAMNAADLFTSNMATASSSLDGFLASDAVTGYNASYLFLLHCTDDDAAAVAATTAFRARLAARPGGKVLARMHFAAECVSKTGALADWLDQWTTPTTIIGGATLYPSVARLDGKYEACPWPSENQALTLVDGGDGCKPLDKTKHYSKSDWVVVTSEGCSPDTAAAHGTGSGAGGAVVVAAKGSDPIELTNCGRGVATMVPAEAGAAMVSQVKAAGDAGISALLSSPRAPGAFAAIDAAGHIQEVGWEKYSTLEMLSWAAQYLDYKAELAANLTKAAYIVPIFDRQFEGATATIEMPPVALLTHFSDMHIDMQLTCEGNMDEQCPAWDHNIALGVVCAPTAAEATARAVAAQAAARQARQQLQDQEGLGEPGGFIGELARWVTPFRRRVGRWLTPATPLMPMLLDPKNRSCAFHTDGPNWVSTLSLRFSGDGLQEAPPMANTRLFSGGGFGETYNDNRTLLLTPPSTGRAGAGALRFRKVELHFLLSGHGTMEFMPSTHTFTVNGKDFVWTSEGVAGTGLGCTKHVRQGRVQPNEHGTWYTGRNGWCNGADVPPRVFDVTSAVAAGTADTVNVTYHALAGGRKEPGKQGGNIVLSSSLAWYV